MADKLDHKLDHKLGHGRHGGDIKGLVDRLDYIAGMGFTQLWPTELKLGPTPRGRLLTCTAWARCPPYPPNNRAPASGCRPRLALLVALDRA
jgi:hypothetical protein